MSNDINCGTLYIISTPIGNMEDITLRAIRILQEVDVILCEDTRVTDKLLKAHGITGKTLVACNDQTEIHLIQTTTNNIQNGRSYALVSDAGTPLISDPGFRIVNAIYDSGGNVDVVPGPCSVIAALTLSCMPVAEFMFAGFMPNKSQARINRLMELKSTKATLIFFESPTRLINTLNDIAQVYSSEQRIAVIREITKIYQEKIEGTVVDVLEQCKKHSHLKGEIVLLLDRSNIKPSQYTSCEISKMANQLAIELSCSKSEAAKTLAKRLGLPKSVVYDAITKNE